METKITTTKIQKQQKADEERTSLKEYIKTLLRSKDMEMKTLATSMAKSRKLKVEDKKEIVKLFGELFLKKESELKPEQIDNINSVKRSYMKKEGVNLKIKEI